MPIFATAGAKFYIGGPLEANFSAPLNAASFAGQTWVEVNPLENIGSFGDTANEVAFTAIGDSRTRKLKGARDAGTLELSAAIDYADAGQVAMLAAEASPNSFAFRVVFNDAPVGGTPSERLFVGLVMSAAEQLDGADNIMKVSFRVAVNSNVVRVAAAEDD